jgi:hypothetical protein
MSGHSRSHAERPDAADQNANEHQPVQRERRRTPRIRVIHEMAGCDIAANLPILVRDVSLGGFRIEANHAIPCGAVRTFAFTVADGTTHVLQARSVHTSYVTGSGQSLFEVGFEFLKNPATQAAAAALLEHAASGTRTRHPLVELQPTETRKPSVVGLSPTRC